MFLCFSIFLFTRAVDGHGAVQTLEAKLISFAVWGIFYLGVLAVEWLIYLIVRLSQKQNPASRKATLKNNSGTSRDGGLAMLVAIGAVAGAFLGLSCGLMLGNIGTGIAIGMIMGASIGAVIGACRDSN